MVCEEICGRMSNYDSDQVSENGHFSTLIDNLLKSLRVISDALCYVDRVT